MTTDAEFRMWPERALKALGNPTSDDSPFNLKFDPATGEETASIWVGDRRFSQFDWATKQEDAKLMLAYHACVWMGRVSDLPRCRACAVRQHDDGRIEIRLRFGPPWYWSQISDAANKPGQQLTGNTV